MTYNAHLLRNLIGEIFVFRHWECFRLNYGLT